MKKMIGTLFLFTLLSFAATNLVAVKIEKALIYNRYTPPDSSTYNKEPRVFQWEKMASLLDSLGKFQRMTIISGILTNYKNQNGKPPLAKNATPNDYNGMQDAWQVPQNQAIPLYLSGNLTIPERYGRDGWLVRILKDTAGYVKVKLASINGTWLVPKEYVQSLGVVIFVKVIFVDRTNQNITTMEQGDSVWLVRSMNPVTTGLKRPPYMQETPRGIFVIQKQIPEMLFYKDGTSEEGGFAPYASRFSNGAYLHGIPVNYPATHTIEYSPLLGTVPRSHMCVRNATSHAEFIYDWAPEKETLVIVLD